MTAEAEVLAANHAFYSAFADRRLDAMNEVWATEHPVACIHPGWECLQGREAVLSSFRSILSSVHSPRVRPTEENVVLLGGCAFVTCIERIGEAELIATNIFVREESGWKLAHHHAAPLAPRKTPEPPSPNRLN